MRVSKAEEYGLRLVMRLAEGETRLTVRQLADSEELPETTVAKVVSKLRAAGLVRAERGRNGGYSLSSPAGEVTLAAVISAFGNRVYDRGFCERMTPGDGSCAHSGSCDLRPVWRSLTEVIRDFLSGITVADVISQRYAAVQGAGASLPLLLADESKS